MEAPSTAEIERPQRKGVVAGFLRSDPPRRLRSNPLAGHEKNSIQPGLRLYEQKAELVFPPEPLRGFRLKFLCRRRLLQVELQHPFVQVS